MTAMLACDGCGQIVSERPEDADPTALWWSLIRGPVIGEGGMLPMIAFDLELDDEMEPVDLPPPEPQRHFCSEECIDAWRERRQAMQ